MEGSGLLADAVIADNFWVAPLWWSLILDGTVSTKTTQKRNNACTRRILDYPWPFSQNSPHISKRYLWPFSFVQFYLHVVSMHTFMEIQ